MKSKEYEYRKTLTDWEKERPVPRLAIFLFRLA